VPKAPFTRNLREALASLEAHRASRGAGEGATEGGLSILYRAAFEPAQAELRLLIEELDR
jgi:hypothetical protein